MKASLVNNYSRIKVHINISALQHNLLTVRALAPNSKVLAMIKANGYGHDSLIVAQSLQQADAFGVAYLTEALPLRLAGISKRIVLMQGFVGKAELDVIISQRLEPVLHNYQQVYDVIKYAKDITVWLKINTGMHRLGFAVEEFAEILSLLQTNSNVTIAGIMSHFASANALFSEPGHMFSAMQAKTFNNLLQNYPVLAKSMANSAAILNWPGSCCEWVRPGLMLYGISPIANKTAQELCLQPVMTVTTVLIAKHNLRPGDQVGYEGNYIASCCMQIGIISIGYADGYPRAAPNGTPVYINGKYTKTLGKVSMDMLAIDLTEINAKIGDAVVLWGDPLPIEAVANKINCSPYELITGLSTRVERIAVTSKHKLLQTTPV